MAIENAPLMKGVYLTGHGDIEKLEYREDIARPTPSAQQVLIRVSAAGVNNTDINTRTGWYSKSNESDDASWSGKALTFPLIQGADVCGVIVEVGAEVDAKRIGERVLVEPCLTQFNGQPLERFWYFGSECHGGFAEYAVIDSAHAYAVNSSLTDIELASFPCSYSTAENMLTCAQVDHTDTVLISGASGGVGSAAIQLAKARGAKVIAITSESKASLLTELGADEIVLRDRSLQQTLGDNSVDVVIDLVGGEQWPQFLNVLKPRGRYAVAGAIGGALVELDIRTLYLKDLRFYGCTQLETGVFASLIQRIEKGHIRPLVAKTYPLAEIGLAQEAFGSKQHIGKIVLSVSDGHTA
ncbi:zinc-binding dehydrogenase [Vibrio sp. SM6]|uniref:Zinc-binding dehydrogenase n=1 Tax=Vibrio agarilyticus TaxID=2726741 RepID=A0A7X8YIH2_9VIBR|nr:alcohol dehydrogenase family protein [Vibrio agarilyticus]NLS14576.1 zinc-binding dehydrogenase [Vibrio agarilyticus]